jgi:hypothetical protein
LPLARGKRILAASWPGEGEEGKGKGKEEKKPTKSETDPRGGAAIIETSAEIDADWMPELCEAREARRSRACTGDKSSVNGTTLTTGANRVRT